ncbi:SDR family NAD(P)-dependent oxidoreductase [Rhizobium rhizogenes]|uniref:SDR family NAD(P)-dependent oxidoreductase n=1 Tax=Rhizobium rhizogenes TaxID=359 RepID=UPI00157363D9|nr:SDR family oxidoreductase [Rhizobium rhizogenes]NTF96073.1 SDR family oxidoreductase [Rhizobium rhizogenes]
MTRSFDGKLIWVTGASGTIGAAVVRQLALKGATVVASSRQPNVSFDSENVVWMPADVTNDIDVRRTATAIVERYGRIDGVVTASTVPIFGDFLALTDDNWLSVVNAKLFGSVRPVRAALPYMIARGSGSIVLISGRGGLRASPQHLPGSSVNAALILLAQGLATKFGPDGIRVNAISPGPIVSERLEVMQKAGMPQASTALGPAGTADDVADAILFLLSNDARHITGTNLVVDGGGPRTT